MLKGSRFISYIRLLCFSLSAVFFSNKVKATNSAVHPVDSGKKNNPVHYVWKNVQMVGGGFVDGIVFHPTAKGIRYCRTDIGGAYRWSDKAKRWEPIMDWVSEKDNNLMGVESIALDPGDPARVYLACGTYTSSKGPNAILRSTDQGETFSRTDVPFRMGGNENGRGNGERMAVDPHNGNNIYMGTRLDGLWKSADAGATWKKVDNFIYNTQNSKASTTQPFRKSRSVGIVFVLFDGNSGTTDKATSSIYVGVSVKGQENLFCSKDAGLTWQPVTGSPTQFGITHGVLSSDGNLYLTYGTDAGPDPMTDGAVYKFNIHTRQWTDITPVKPDPEHQKAFGYAAISVDAHNPSVIIASSYNRYKAGGEDIFRSIDGGTTWKSVFTGIIKGKFDYSIAPYVKHTGIHWLFDIEIDPTNPDHAMFTTGYGGHETFNFTAMDENEPTIWSDMSSGIEETVALDMVSPVKGASLISAIGDYGGFVHWHLDKASPEGNFIDPRFNNTDAVACGEKAPDVIVRVGESAARFNGPNIGYSLNGGKSWQTISKTPGFGSTGGHISVSADGNIWIWSPQNTQPYLTRDHGVNWIRCEGLQDNLIIVADKENPGGFYAVDVLKAIFFKSTDGGANFVQSKLNIGNELSLSDNISADKRQGTNQLYTTPGKEGDIWLVTVNGLYHSTNGGQSFLKSGAAKDIRAFGFGKPASENAYPVLYLVGLLNEVHGIYRSDDMANNWIRINDDQHQWGLILKIAGDPKVYGRVYIGTHGRGIIYGDAVK